MRQRACEGCGATGPLKEGFLVDERFCCAKCAQTLERTARGQRRETRIARAIDPTLCMRCGLDGGDVEHERVRELPLCTACAPVVFAYPLPRWLVLSGAVLAVLLVVALVRGVPWMRAGLALLGAERLANERRWAEVSDALAPVLAAVPGSDPARLLKIEADLLSDRFENLEELTAPIAGRRLEGARAAEVARLHERWSKAAEEFAAGADAFERKEVAAALPHFERAYRGFEESTFFHRSYLQAQGEVRWAAKDYAGFLAVAEEHARLVPRDPMVVAMLASALAASYASGGDEAHATRAREELARAKELSTDDAARAAFAEYSERIEYRLRTREILDKDEYDRRFRATDGGQK